MYLFILIDLCKPLLVDVRLLNKRPHILLNPLFVLDLFLVTNCKERRMGGCCPFRRLDSGVLGLRHEGVRLNSMIS